MIWTEQGRRRFHLWTLKTDGVHKLEYLRNDFTLQECLGRSFSCGCGKIHTAELRAAEVSSGALLTLSGYMERFGWRYPFVICDSITYEIAGKRVVEILEQAGYPVKCHILTHTAFDEATLGELAIHIDRKCDLVVGVGTGSINDMCRYFSFKLDRPYCIVATAAPMDGFASSVSALTVNNLKTTYEVRMPALVIADVDILKAVPYRMIAAGLGDLIGKFTCLCDWKLARLINDEYYCETTVELVENCIRKVLKNAGAAKDRDPEVIGDIMEGLLLTGVAMGLIGNSRPASGCEHHISHYWEMLFEQQGRRPAPHGAQVGVGTVLILKLTELLRQETIDFSKARAAAIAYDPEGWKEEIRAAYGSAAGGVIEMEARARKNETAGRLLRIDAMERNWEAITALLDQLPTSQQVIGILKSLDAPWLPQDIGVDAGLLRDTLKYCKEVRPRYTILQMIWDLGLLDELTEKTAAFFTQGQIH